jgi:inorganic pyrophosphatase
MDNHTLGLALSFLGSRVTIKVDRPMGTIRPEWGFIYPVNYGYLPGVVAADGEGLDAYLLGVFEPLETYSGECIAIIHRNNDDDDKLVLVPEGVRYTDDQIMALVAFQERFFDVRILRAGMV